MRITISGTAGSGKSTVARELAKMLGYKHYSMGDIQREIAKEKGLTIVELGELEKKDPSIDKMIDDRQKKLGKTEDDFVIDSWLSSLFIPNSFKIFLDADIEVRAKRIAKEREAEKYDTPEQAIKAIKQREKTNRERFLKFYNYDFMDKKNYDLVIDTAGKDILEIVEKIISSSRSSE
jgi:CMP/dCMP kinase